VAQACVVESPTCSEEDRAKLAELLFESLRLSSVCFANSSVLSLFASGRTRYAAMVWCACLIVCIQRHGHRERRRDHALRACV
jgi:actin-related protein